MSIRLTIDFIPSGDKEPLWWEMLSVVEEEEYAVMRRCERLHWRYDSRFSFSTLRLRIFLKRERMKTLCIEGLTIRGGFKVEEKSVFPELPFLEEPHFRNHMTSIRGQEKR